MLGGFWGCCGVAVTEEQQPRGQQPSICPPCSPTFAPQHLGHPCVSLDVGRGCPGTQDRVWGQHIPGVGRMGCAGFIAAIVTLDMANEGPGGVSDAGDE